MQTASWCHYLQNEREQPRLLRVNLVRHCGSAMGIGPSVQCKRVTSNPAFFPQTPVQCLQHSVYTPAKPSSMPQIYECACPVRGPDRSLLHSPNSWHRQLVRANAKGPTMVSNGRSSDAGKMRKICDRKLLPKRIHLLLANTLSH